MARKHQSNGSAVLLYHRVGPRPTADPHGLSVSPETFQAQVEWLSRKGYGTLPAADWQRSVRSGEHIRKKILITFDDAYADIATYALPVLKSHGLSALTFVVTGAVGGTNHWVDSSLSLMPAEQIRYWSNRGFEFASHSHSHRDLTLISETDLDAEIASSKSAIQKLVMNPVPAFAYPFGYKNERVVAAVRKEYEFAFGTEDGLNGPQTDAHSLRRTMVLPKDSLLEFSMRVNRGRNRLTSIRSYMSPIKKLLAGAR